jgi:hypothetical protein
MIIANPISDAAFKWLMDDTRIARFFIATILGETVTEVEVKSQELPYKREGETYAAASIAIFRLDFVATIRTEAGEYKKVLIEIQKTRNLKNIARFRNYLGEHYRREDELFMPGREKMIRLPIVTIYLLGFKLKEIQDPVIKIERQYINQVTGIAINKKDDFIEKLSHDMHIVQIPFIAGKLQSKLEQLLSIFEQNYFIDERGMMKEYPYPVMDENIKMITDKLHYAGTNPENKKILDLERESLDYINEADQEVEEEKKANREKDKMLEEKDKILEEKDKILEEKDRVLEEEKKANQEKDKILEALIKELAELRKFPG